MTADRDCLYYTELLGPVHIRYYFMPLMDELTREQKSAANEFLFHFTYDLDVKCPVAVDLAFWLDHILSGDDHPFDPPEITPFLDFEHTLNAVRERIELAFEWGNLVVISGAEPLLGLDVEWQELSWNRDNRPIPWQPPPPPPPKPRNDLLPFEVCFVDEEGEAIGGLDVEITAGPRSERLQTNLAGRAFIDDVPATSGQVSVLDIKQLESLIEPRWGEKRGGTEPKGKHVHFYPFTG